MAYGQGWDPSAPDGAITPAADIDTELQNLKTAIGERLVQVIPEWADDLENPKKLALVIGDIASRPATPDFAGEAYFAYDTATLYIADTTPEWVSTGGINTPEEGDDTSPSQSLHFSGNKQGNQTIGASSSAALTGWVTSASLGSFYAGGAPTRFTFPSSGRYFIALNFLCKGTTAMDFTIRQNSSITYSNKSRYELPHSNWHAAPGLTAITAEVVSGDYIEIMVQNFSALLPAEVSGTYTTISIFRLP